MIATSVPRAESPDRAVPRFEVPSDRVAQHPPEARGLARHDVRLLVAEPERLRHLRFRQLPDVLEPGDLLVVNTSATLPAALDATRADGRAVVVHVAGPVVGAGTVRTAWGTVGPQVVELRRPEGDGPILDAEPGEELMLASGARVRLVAAASPPHRRLWAAIFGLDGPVEDELHRHGRPITYGRVRTMHDLDAYQPAVARHPGSAEMASAARPLTSEVITDLATRGVVVAPVVLHAGVSSLEAGELPPPERFEVPAVTARLVEHTRRHGGRVLAVGTTVTRALETVATTRGEVRAASGWTDLILGPERPARVVDGLITGWHDADASHLLLLEAVAGPELVGAAYDAALAGPYLWHEFGDSCLFLPGR